VTTTYDNNIIEYRISPCHVVILKINNTNVLLAVQL
jgi:hypothetical protein